ncbi:MAG: ComF family protein [Candidatus Peregrinibacteria bacterium]|nr:ComF family protein [Candidatus Peregrinibacteria bacterium]
MRKLGEVFIQGEICVDGFTVFFAAEHSELLKKVLHRFKYISDDALAEVLGMLLVMRMKKIIVSAPYTLTPIPLHHARERERGFNQSELLAGVISRALGGRVVHVLERRRETRVQATLSRKERIYNVRGAFGMRKGFVGKVPETVFVLDDVITTGSTFVECARVLRAAGVRRVYGIMLAHGL